VLEAFVGIFCICMPALRRFLANVLPKCFGSTQTDSKYRNYDEAGTPNKLSSGRPKNSKGSISFGKAFGSTGITKTTETTVESRREDDEVMLVELERGTGTSVGMGTGTGTVSRTSMERTL
jgi:ribosomal protein L11 methylase PrmA